MDAPQANLPAAEEEPGVPSAPARPAGPAPGAGLKLNRQQALEQIREVERQIWPARWRTGLAAALLAAVCLWFIIDTLILNLFTVHKIEVTRAQVERGEVIQVPEAESPWKGLINFYNQVSSGQFDEKLAFHPIPWMVFAGLLWVVARSSERTQTQPGFSFLRASPKEFLKLQSHFFQSPAGVIIPAGTGAEDNEEEDDEPEDEALSKEPKPPAAETSYPVFGEDLPPQVRNLLLWWDDKQPPDRSNLENGLAELRKYLGPDAYLWLRACAALPSPVLHLAMFLGKGLRNAKGDIIYGFENADKLQSLPWFIHERMPLWLRKHLLASLSKADQQRIRYLLQCLLISTAKGCKTDLALEIAHHQHDFMRVCGNSLSNEILEAAPEDSPLREPLFRQFVQRGLDEEFYENMSDFSLDEGKSRGRLTAGQKKPSRRRRLTPFHVVSSLLWTTCGVALAGCVVFLVFFSEVSGFRVKLDPNIGIIKTSRGEKEIKKNPLPYANFLFLPAGRREIEINSRDFLSHELKIDLPGRVFADLGEIELTHRRTGRLGIPTREELEALRDGKPLPPPRTPEADRRAAAAAASATEAQIEDPSPEEPVQGQPSEDSAQPQPLGAEASRDPATGTANAEEESEADSTDSSGSEDDDELEQLLDEILSE